MNISERSQEILDALQKDDPLTLDDIDVAAPRNKELTIADGKLRIDYRKNSQTYSIFIPFDKVQEALRPR